MNRKGFTLIELMVVILIVAILAAVAIPILRARIDSAKWSEGKAMMGTIATAIRAYTAEHNLAPTGTSGAVPADLLELGFAANDLQGSYFSDADFTWAAAGGTSALQLTFTVTCTSHGVASGTTAEPPATPGGYQFDSTTGKFVAQ